MKVAFYKETEFQDTTAGKIPKEWTVAKLDQVLSLEYGKGLPEKEREPGSYPVVGSNGIVGYHNQALVKGPGIVVGRKGTIGAVSWIDSDFWPIDTTYYVNLKRNDIFLKWLFIELKYLNLRKLSLSDVVPGLKRDLVYSLKTPIPSLEEQRVIVNVLGVVDSAVELVDRVIAKTERLKKGLMQALLTRGIGHKEYKQTPIGKIPKEWNVLALQDFCKVTDGSHWSPKEVEKSSYKIATVANLKETYIDLDSCKSISEEDYQRLVKEGDVPRKGDILFSKDGTVGICFAFKQHANIGLLSSIAIIKPDNKILNSDFGAYALKSPNVFRQIIGRKTGTALRRITLEHLKTVKIPVPPVAEQQRIAEILSIFDKKLELEKSEKAKLERVKQCLMDLLLTGKIRVKVD
jgi:type I restriction enzyme S subunit